MSSLSWRQTGNAGVQSSPLTGVTRTIERSGDRMGCVVRLRGSAGEERARLQSLAAALRGRANRIYLSDVSTPRRGAMVSTESLSNADFASGTTGWTALRSTLRVRDGVLRAINGKTAGVNAFGAYQSVTLTQYAPYALRGHIQNLSRSSTSNGTVLTDPNYVANAAGMITQSVVNRASGAQDVYPLVLDSNGTVMQAGDYGELAYASLARCLEVDNGQNRFSFSQDFTNAAWTKSACTPTANTDVGPNGNTEADSINEDTSTGQHFFQQGYTVGAAAADFCLAIAAKAGSRGFMALQWLEATGPSTTVTAYFNLATGVVGPRTRVQLVEPAHLLGRSGKWVVRLLPGRAQDERGDPALWHVLPRQRRQLGELPRERLGDPRLARHGGAGLGAGAPGHHVDRDGGHLPDRLPALPARGPASVAGALLAGDMVEIKLPTYSHLVRLTAPVDFDAAGLGSMSFEPSLPQSPADGAAVIVHQPMGRFLLASDEVEYETEPGRISDFTFEFVQDLAP